MHDRAALRRLAPALLLAAVACGEDTTNGLVAPPDAATPTPALSVTAETTGLSSTAGASVLTLETAMDAVTDLRDRVTLSTPRTFKRNAEGKLNQLLDAMGTGNWSNARAALNNVRSFVDGTTDQAIVAELEVFRISLAEVEVFLQGK